MSLSVSFSLFFLLFQDYDETELRKRLRLESATPSIHAHCKLYDEMDIMLDSWPFSGHITTVEALMMGVPVITLSVKGENGSHSQNVSASILERVGLSDLVAHSEDEFVAKALALSKVSSRFKFTLQHRSLARVKCQSNQFLTDRMSTLECTCIGVVHNYHRTVSVCEI